MNVLLNESNNTETFVTIYVLRYTCTTPTSASGKLKKLSMVIALLSKYIKMDTAQ